MNSDKHEGVLVLHGTDRRFNLKAGEEMAVTMPDGCQGGDFSFPGFDQSLTRNILGWEKFGKPWLVFSAGEGSRSTMASSRGGTPTLSNEETGTTGNTLPAATALRRPAASSSR